MGFSLWPLFLLAAHLLHRMAAMSGRSWNVRTGESGAFGMWHHHRGYVLNFLVRQPHLRCVEKVGNPLQTKQGN